MSLVACQRQTKLSIVVTFFFSFFFRLQKCARGYLQMHRWLWLRHCISYQTVRRRFVSFTFDSFSCPSVLLHETANCLTLRFVCLFVCFFFIFFFFFIDITTTRQPYPQRKRVEPRRVFRDRQTDRRHVLPFFFFFSSSSSLDVCVQSYDSNGFD